LSPILGELRMRLWQLRVEIGHRRTLAVVGIGFDHYAKDARCLATILQIPEGECSSHCLPLEAH